jgi:hypothetical protein
MAEDALAPGGELIQRRTWIQEKDAVPQIVSTQFNPVRRHKSEHSRFLWCIHCDNTLCSIFVLVPYQTLPVGLPK